MLKKLITLTLTVFLASVSVLALAKNGGQAGGKSVTHMSTESVANTNGPESADRDKGQDRAEDRRSVNSQVHDKQVSNKVSQAKKHPDKE